MSAIAMNQGGFLAAIGADHKNRCGLVVGSENRDLSNRKHRGNIRFLRALGSRLAEHHTTTTDKAYTSHGAQYSIGKRYDSISHASCCSSLLNTPLSEPAMTASSETDDAALSRDTRFSPKLQVLQGS